MDPDLVPVVAGAATASGSCASLPVCPPGPGHAGSASLDRQSLLPASAGPFCYGAGKRTAVNGACARRRLAFVRTRITEDSRKQVLGILARAFPPAVAAFWIWFVGWVAARWFSARRVPPRPPGPAPRRPDRGG